MNDSTLLHRVIKPDWLLQDGRVSSQAFRPTKSDEGLLSVYDGDKISAEESHVHYIKDPSKPVPIGVLAVSVQDCVETDLPVRPDPETFPEHVLIDFRKFGTNQIKRKSRKLCSVAMDRGWQFRP